MLRRIILLPAVLIGCMFVIWVGTVAAAQMPSQDGIALTMTAAADNEVLKAPEGSPPQEVNAEILSIGDQRCHLPPSYPEDIQRWCSIIEAAADQTGVPSSLIAAVMLQESGGEPLSYSSSGAVGLMQVMPRDGLASAFMCVNGPCFASRPTIEELQDPALNVAYGSQLLADLYAKHGSYREALFRYGPIDMGYYYADLVLNIWGNYQ